MVSQHLLAGAVPEIPVSDVVAATEYYRDKPSFSVDWLEADMALAGISRDQCRLFVAGPAFRECMRQRRSRVDLAQSAQQR